MDVYIIAKAAAVGKGGIIGAVSRLSGHTQQLRLLFRLKATIIRVTECVQLERISCYAE